MFLNRSDKSNSSVMISNKKPEMHCQKKKKTESAFNTVISIVKSNIERTTVTYIRDLRVDDYITIYLSICILAIEGYCDSHSVRSGRSTVVRSRSVLR
jgi:hypothetical protein